MPSRLQDKVAIVFGAGSVGPGWGNGKATATLFAREGAHVVCVDFNPDAANETVKIIASEGGSASAAICDVTRSEQVKQIVDDVVARHGRIDVLHNNVGYATMGGPIELSEDEWAERSDRNWAHFLSVLAEDSKVINDFGSVAHSLGFKRNMFNTAESRLSAFYDEVMGRVGPG